MREDDLGHPVAVPGRVRRVVSLVPSLTEAVAVSAPGLLVGATDWCSHPADLDVPRVGGTKNPDVAAVVGREPDLDAMRAAGLAVWVTAPRTLDQAIDSLARMLAACGVDRPHWLDAAVE